MKLLVVRDESSKIFGHRWLNSQISLFIGLIQLSICIWAMAQHVFSLSKYNEILYCDFVNGSEPVLLVGVDIIIFDVGLFHSLWGIESCIAEHLDGGYGRFGWCVCHISAFVICLPIAFISRPKPYSLWPLLIQQSAYGVGLLILSLAALPRVLPTFTGDNNAASLFSVSIYAAGATMNFFLLYIFWHWYWHVESMWDSAHKVRSDHAVINPNNRTKRALIRYRPEPSGSTSNDHQSLIIDDDQSQHHFAQSSMKSVLRIVNGSVRQAADHESTETAALVTHCDSPCSDSGPCFGNSDGTPQQRANDGQGSFGCRNQTVGEACVKSNDYDSKLQSAAKLECHDYKSEQRINDSKSQRPRLDARREPVRRTSTTSVTRQRRSSNVQKHEINGTVSHGRAPLLRSDIDTLGERTEGMMSTCENAKHLPQYTRCVRLGYRSHSSNSCGKSRQYVRTASYTSGWQRLPLNTTTKEVHCGIGSPKHCCDLSNRPPSFVSFPQCENMTNDEYMLPTERLPPWPFQSAL
ncbi:hypothetical protein AB6A40_003093 [Gnathostoma spinigerum]|uniref:Transmembrane protein n=1 Tax=Gnathostoma spinigerum TaxID=75299 RepID=A0ABD6EGC2_9BILA